MLLMLSKYLDGMSTAAREERRLSLSVNPHVKRMQPEVARKISKGNSKLVEVAGLPG